MNGYKVMNNEKNSIHNYAPSPIVRIAKNSGRNKNQNLSKILTSFFRQRRYVLS